MSDEAAELPPTSLLVRTKHGFAMLGGPPTRPPPADDPTPLDCLGTISEFGTFGGQIGEFSPDGTMFAAAAGTLPAVELRNVASGAAIGDLGASSARVQKIAWSPLGTFLLTWQPPDKDGLPDGSLRVWNVATSTCVASFHMKQLRREAWPGVQWSADEV